MLSRMIAKGNKSKEIGDVLGIDSTSVSREVKRNHIKIKEIKSDGTLCKDCLHKRGCTIKKVCGSLSCNQRCNGCKAITKCWKYEKFYCIYCNYKIKVWCWQFYHKRYMRNA